MGTIEVLKLSPYCYPERISSTHLTQDLNEAFYHASFHTTIHAPTPCRGIDDTTREKYKMIKHEQMLNGSIDIYRFSLFKEGRNPIVRAVRYVLCNFIQYHKGIREKNVDIIFSGSTPPTQGILCGKVALKLSKEYGRKVPFIYNLQDVFPDSLVAAGLTSKGSLLWKIGRKIEDRTYNYADKIIVISEDIKENIIKKGVPKSKIVVIPNWIDTDEVHPVSRKENTLFDELGISRDKFIVVYAGNLGKAQDIDSLLEVAPNTPNVEYVIFGNGSNKEAFAAKIKGHDNIHLFPLMPVERISEVYSMGNLCLVSCKKGMGSGAVPSKTYSIMAAGTPVLLNYDSGTTLWGLIKDKKCGICTHAGDPHEIEEAINYAVHHEDVILEMGANARKCAEQSFSREIATRSIIKEMNMLIK